MNECSLGAEVVLEFTRTPKLRFHRTCGKFLSSCLEAHMIKICDWKRLMQWDIQIMVSHRVPKHCPF